MDIDKVRELRAAFDATRKVWKPVAVQVKKVNEDEGSVDVVISTSEIDRDGDRVEQLGIEVPDNGRVPLVAAHWYADLLSHIGQVRDLKFTAKKSTATPVYFRGLGNAQADWGWVLVQLGVAAYSIGFIPKEVIWADLNDEKVAARVRDGKEPWRVFVKSELAEVSHVIVPSNRNAVQRLADMGVLTGKSLDEAMAKSVDTPLHAKADFLLRQAFERFEATRPTKVVAEVKVPASAGDGAPAEEDPDVMALFSEVAAAPEAATDEEASPVAEASPDEVAPPLGSAAAGELRTYVDGVVEELRGLLQSQADAAAAADERVYETIRSVEAGLKAETSTAVASAVEAQKAYVKDAVDAMAASLRKEVADSVGPAVAAALGNASPDSLAYVTSTKFVDTLMAGVLQLVDERIMLVRGHPDKFEAEVRNRKRK